MQTTVYRSREDNMDRAIRPIQKLLDCEAALLEGETCQTTKHFLSFLFLFFFKYTVHLIISMNWAMKRRRKKKTTANRCCWVIVIGVIGVIVMMCRLRHCGSRHGRGRDWCSCCCCCLRSHCCCGGCRGNFENNSNSLRFRLDPKR